jgi:copper chaperone
MVQLQLAISGMTCGHCVARVTKALGALPGVLVEKVDVGSALVSYRAAAVSAESILRAVRDLGYEAEAPEAA